MFRESLRSRDALIPGAVLALGSMAHAQITVPGTSGKPDGPLVQTGLFVSAGNNITVAATGAVSIGPGGQFFGPDGEPGSDPSLHWVPTAPCAALIGEIGGQAVLLGSSFSGAAWASGELLLGVNDNYHPDNLGSFSVMLSHDGPPAGFEISGSRVVPDLSVFGTGPGGFGGGGCTPGGSGLAVSGKSGCGNWTSTGITLNDGDSFSTSATGCVTVFAPGGQYFGPNGEPSQFSPSYCVSNQNNVSLIGKIGGGAPFKLGASFAGVVTGPGGELQLGVNDDYYPDNGGTFYVSVTLGASTSGGGGSLIVNDSTGLGPEGRIVLDHGEPLRVKLDLPESSDAFGTLYVWRADVHDDIRTVWARRSGVRLSLTAGHEWRAPEGAASTGRFFVQGLVFDSKARRAPILTNRLVLDVR